MKIVVTGATSFLAEKYIRFLASCGDNEIIAVIRKGSNKADELRKIKSVSIVESNMDEYYLLGGIIGACDIFVHFAWNGTRGDNRNNPEIQKENYDTSLAAIKSLVDAGCKKVITSGSQAEYGIVNETISEETACNPNTEYGKYKYKLYLDAKQYCEANNTVLIEPRYFSLYGPNDCDETLIMSCINKMKINEPCELTQCTQIWNFLFLDDAIRALYSLTVNDCESGVYNVASTDNRPLKEYVEEIKRVLNSSSELRFGAKEYPKTGAVSIQTTPNKLIKATGWQPTTLFMEGIINIIKTYG